MAETEMREEGRRYQEWLQGDGDVLKESSNKKTTQEERKSQRGRQRMSVSRLVFGSLCQGHTWPKTRDNPNCRHLPRPPRHWPNSHWLISFQAFTCDLRATSLYHSAVFYWNFFILMLCGVNLSFYIYINAYFIQKKYARIITGKTFRLHFFFLFMAS